MLVRSRLPTDTTHFPRPFYPSGSLRTRRAVCSHSTRLVSRMAMPPSTSPSLTPILTIVLTAVLSRVVFYALPKVKGMRRHGLWIVSPSSMLLMRTSATSHQILVVGSRLPTSRPRAYPNSARAIRRMSAPKLSLNSIYCYKVLTMLSLETRKMSGMCRSSPTKIQRGHWLSSSALCLRSNPTRSATSSLYSATSSKN